MFIIDFNLDNYKKAIESLGIMMINANVKQGSRIEIAEFNDFIRLLEVYSIKVVYSEIYFYDESNFDLLTLDDIEEKYRVQSINKKIDDYNNRLQSMRYLIGKEEFIDLYFNNQGVIYHFSWCDSALEETNINYFIEYLDTQFSKEIEANEEQQRNEEINKRNAYLSKLKDYMKNDITLLYCTNQDLRKSYASKISEKEELLPPEGMPYINILSVVNEIWSEVKHTRRSR